MIALNDIVYVNLQSALELLNSSEKESPKVYSAFYSQKAKHWFSDCIIFLLMMEF